MRGGHTGADYFWTAGKWQADLEHPQGERQTAAKSEKCVYSGQLGHFIVVAQTAL